MAWREAILQGFYKSLVSSVDHVIMVVVLSVCVCVSVTKLAATYLVDTLKFGCH